LTADPEIAACETDVQYNLYNASLMDFSNVVYDRLSAGTENDGSALMSAVTWYSGFPLDMKVQAVDDDGNSIALTEDVFKAIKPEEVGSLVRFDFNAKSGAKLKFSFGRDSDGLWTPIEMPFLTITLLDFDCGVVRKQCEEVTSADHSSYEGGENVTITEYDGYVAFENLRGLLSNAENNPKDVVLTEEQKSLAVSLVFKDRDHFTLGMHNYAAYPRTILMAGISNKQWEGVVTPAPTPRPTEISPTPSPPTCAFSAGSGACSVECDCITSPNYPGDYSASDHCVIDVAQATTLHVREFLTEQDYDLLWVNGQNYSYTDGPDGVLAEGQIEWTSDTSGTEKGWSICTDAPTPSPPGPISVNGMCEADDRCVSSPNYPENYGTLLSCNITFNVDATLHVVEFETELGYDTLTVEGVVYSGLDSPDLVEVAASSQITFTSDWGTTHKGWKVCTDDATTTEGISTWAVGDPHISSVTGEAFDLWRTGWSTFVQIPQHSQAGSTKLLIDGHVKPYTAAPCAPAFLQEVRMNGTWLPGEISVRAGSLESSEPFEVSVDGKRSHVEPHGTTFMDEQGVTLRGWIDSEDLKLWGPDARVQLAVGNAQVNIVQHTEGRGETSRSMLDLSVSGLSEIVDTIGGWLGVDGSMHAGKPPAGCEGAHSAQGDRPRYIMNQMDQGFAELSLLSSKR
jgi:hypothetical protein